MYVILTLEKKCNKKSPIMNFDAFVAILKIVYKSHIFKDFSIHVIWTVVLGVVRIRSMKMNHLDGLQPYVEQKGVWILRLP